MVETVLNTIKQDANSEIVQIVPSIVIGIGGSGHDIVNSLKKQIKGVLGDLPVIQFLVFDADSKKEDSALKDSEFIELTVEYADDYIKAIDRNQELKAWWPEDLKKIGDITQGAKETRPIGRFAFYRNIDKIRNILQDRIEYIRQPKSIIETENKGYSVKRDLKVFIVNSLGGGSGSGMFLDMAYNVRDIVKKCSISGYAILPDIFEMDETNRARVGANTYAALLELDHYMRPDSSFNCTYRKHLDVASDDKPFDYYYIIGADSEDYFVNVKYRNAVEMIANSIFLDIASNVGLVADSAKDNIDSILRTYLQPEAKKHLRAYGILGYYALYHPAPEIKDVCIYRYAESLIDEILKPIEGMDEIVNSMVRNIKSKRSFEIDDLKKSLHDKKLDKPVDIEGVHIEEIEEKDRVDKLKAWSGKEKEKVEREVVSEIQKRRAEILKEYENVLSKDIEDIVEDASKGFRVGCGVIDSMISYFSSQKSILESKNKEPGQLETDLKKLQENIDKTILDLDGTVNSPIVLFKTNKIRRYTGVYIDFCVDYLNKYIDLHREKELKLAYIELLNVLSNLKGNLEELERKLTQIKKDLTNEKEKSIHKLKNGGSFQLEKWVGTSGEVVDRVFARYTTSLKDGKWMVCQNVLYNWKDYEILDIYNTVVNFSTKQYENVSMSIEDVLPDMNGGIKNVLDSSRVQMTYSRESILEGFRPEKIEEVNILGVPEKLAGNTNEVVKNVSPEKSSKIRVTPTKSNTRISNVVYKYGIPLITIGPIRKLKNYYEQAKESRERPLHILKINLEDIIKEG